MSSLQGDIAVANFTNSLFTNRFIVMITYAHVVDLQCDCSIPKCQITLSINKEKIELIKCNFILSGCIGT